MMRMIPMKTSELKSFALEWAVAKCENKPLYGNLVVGYKFSTDWAQGGPIIEREGISITPTHDTHRWFADIQLADDYVVSDAFGSTPLIAAMRCYVASRLGDEIEIPQELQ
jgi:hypothetical protein